MPNLNVKARELMQTRIVAATRQYSARDLAVLMHTGSFSGIPIIDPREPFGRNGDGIRYLKGSGRKERSSLLES